ncbi:MAG TPA: AMP-binding protein, partial [Cyclobacteriaceae bacterium]|nr:AMP-binding protein [Cyclobacteriaceae bacterium]
MYRNMNTIDPHPNILSNQSPNRISPLEIKQILQVFNGTASVYPKNITILKLFDTQVEKSPESVAVISGTKKLTYRALDEASNQLARYLRSKGIREETMVPILMERSLELVIGILGILKAGGAYVPIDPEHPRDRIDAIVRETGALWLLTDRLNHEGYQPGANVQQLVWEEIHSSLLQLPVGKVQTNLTPSNLAYVIFTSGSTGTPKGVMVEHAQLVASSLARNNYYSPLGAVLLIPSVAFDASVAAIFGSVGNGNCLILCPQDQIKDPGQLKSLLANTDTILCIPSYYHFLLDEGLVQGSRLSTV